MSIRGYAVGDPLLRVGPYAVHRGYRAVDRVPVLLKLVARPSPRRAEVDALAREFALLDSLALPGVPRVIEFLGGDDDTALVLEDAPGP